MQVVWRRSRLRHRPIGGVYPVPAMVQPALGRAPSATASHQQQPHGQLPIRRGTQHLAEEAQPMRQPVASPGVDRGRRSELHVAGMRLAARAMCPWPQDESLRSLPSPFQPGVVTRRRQLVGFKPGQPVHAGRRALAIVPALRPGCPTAATSCRVTVPPRIEKIGLVIRMVPQQRVAGLPGHVGISVLQFLGAQHQVGSSHNLRRAGNSARYSYRSPSSLLGD